MLSRWIRFLAAAAALTVAAGCGTDPTTVPADDHTPATYTILVNDVTTTPPLTLTQGETVRIRLKFVNAAHVDLDAVESTHFGGLALEPTSLATVSRVTDHNYQFNVTGGTPGTGMVRVGYGHDQLADETSLTPFGMTVQAAPSGPHNPLDVHATPARADASPGTSPGLR